MSNENKKSNGNYTSTGKEKKVKYRCERCGTEFYITVKPTFCAICGGDQIFRGSKKSEETAKKHIAECNDVIIQIKQICEKLTDLYIRYMKAHELLKGYARRGIIDKDQVPTYKFPNMTKAFYASRKKRVKEDSAK